MTSQNSKALVTLTIGERHTALWEKYCKPGWTAYAARHGYDIIAIREPLDRSQRAQSRSPAWQKCLIVDDERVASYDRVVWVDSDIVINTNGTPDICEGVPTDKIGAVNERAAISCIPRLEMLRRQQILWGDNRDAYENVDDYYTSFGLPSGFPEIVQTGVLVLSPRHHRDLLTTIYTNYEDKGPEWQYEMRPMSWEFLNANAVHWIDPRFNLIWFDEKCLHYPFLFPRVPHGPFARFTRLAWMLYNRVTVEKRCADAALRNSYFLHFAGHPNNVALCSQERADKLFT